MFTANFLLALILIIAIIGMATADFSCTFGDFVCKSVTCRNCMIATCATGDCICTGC